MHAKPTLPGALVRNVPCLCALVLPAFFACTGPGDSGSTGDNSGDNSGDNGGDNGGGGDCGDFNGGVGSVLSYEYTDEYSQQNGVSGGFDVTFDSYDAATGAAVYTSTAETDTAQSTSTSTSVQNLECRSDGLYAISTTVDYVVNAGGQQFTGTTTTTYDPAALLQPLTLDVGSTWDSSFEGTTTDSMAGSQDFSFSQAAEVVAAESVTVPAGTYDSLKVTYSPSNGSPSNAWLAVGVGTVKTDASELVSVQ